ncbi:SLAP domain-containing protein, partial [Lactobacillus helveticus]
DKLVKVLKNAKIVKINGKRYYQIGRNKFVKVANFEITTHAVHFKARLKGNKKVRAYNRAGKFNKHYA